MAAIEVNKVTKLFNSRTILDQVTFSVPEGALVGIYGKSGSGKSTLLNMIAGIEPVSSGEISVFGQKVGKMNSEKNRLLLRDYIGIMFQNYALIENETVEKNVRIALKYRKDKTEGIVSEALKDVGLEGFEKKKVFELSGGEQQRVAMARLLVKPCKLILADEPTGNVDSSNKRTIMNLFQLFKKRGKTIMVVTHDESLKEFFDYSLYIKEKRIISEFAVE